VFAAKLKPTLPLPEPVAPEVTVIQAGVLLAAVQLHDDPLETLIVRLPAVAGTSNELALNPKEHATAA